MRNTRKALSEGEHGLADFIDLLSHLKLQSQPAFPSSGDSSSLSDSTLDPNRSLSKTVPSRLSRQISEHYMNLFLSAPSTFRVLISCSHTDTDLWRELTSREVQPSALISFLHWVMQTESNDLGIAAASLYILLLKFPGALLHHIYSASVIHSVISVIDQWTHLVTDFGSSKSGWAPVALDTNASEGQEEGGDDVMASVDESTTNVPEMEPACIDSVMLLLEELANLCQTFQLTAESDAFISILHLFSKFTRISSVRLSSKTTVKNGARDYLNEIEEVSYRALRELSLHHEGGPIFAIIVKGLLSNLLPSTWNVAKTVPKHAQRIRERTLSFLIELVGTCDRTVALGSLYILLQHLCHRVSERAEHRSTVQGSVVEILSYFMSVGERTTFEKFVNFLQIYGGINQSPLFRLFALELIEPLLFSGWLQLNNSSDDADRVDSEKSRQLNIEDKKGNCSTVTLIRFVMSRMYDPIVAVKLRVLRVLNALLQRGFDQRSDASSHEFCRAVFDELLCVPDVKEQQRDEQRMMEQGEDENIEGDKSGRSSPISCFSVKAIHHYMRDERSSLRKSAVQLLETVVNIFCSKPFEFESTKRVFLNLSESDFQLFRRACLDPFLIVRKQGVISISQLFERFPSSAWLQRLWMRNVPLLIADSEQVVRNLVSKSFKKIVLEAFYSKEKPCDWSFISSVLGELGRGEDGLVGHSLRGLLSYMWQNPEKDRSFDNMCTFYEELSCELLRLVHVRRLGILAQTGAWMILCCLSQVSPSVIPIDPLVEILEEVKLMVIEKDESVSFKVFDVLSNLSERLPLDFIRELERYLRLRIQSFSCSLDQISSHVSTCAILRRFSDKRTRNNSIFFAGIYEKIESELASVVIESNEEKFGFDFDRLDCILFTFGEVVRYGGWPKKASVKRVTSLVQTLVTPSFTLVRSGNEHIPSRTRAHAFVVLGRLCARDFQLAKACIAAFCRELEVSSYDTIRNNVLVVLCDLATKFPNIVDSYIHHVFGCLRDESELVRRHSLFLLAKLMSEDYVKLQRTGHFFKLLLPLVDASREIRAYTARCLDLLVEKTGLKASEFFFGKFVETIFVLNDYRLHPKYNQRRCSEREKQQFSLAGGDQSRKNRFFVYKFFFDRMLDDQKLQISFKLCAEILQEFVDQNLPLENARHVLYDTLCILSSQEIKMKHVRVSDVGDETLLTSVGAHQQLGEARGKLLSGVIKRNIIENIAPTVIQLKYMLAQRRSPLLRHVIDYLVSLTVEFKDEMQQLLLTNLRLARELEYEMKQSRSAAVQNMTSPWASEVRKKNRTDMSKARHVRRVSLASAAVAPTPWRKGAQTDLGDQLRSPTSVPRLKLANRPPYVPSPAMRSVSTADATVPGSAGEIESSSVFALSSATKILSTPGCTGIQSIGFSSPTLLRLHNSAVLLNAPSSGTISASSDITEEKDNAMRNPLCRELPPRFGLRARARTTNLGPSSPSEMRHSKMTKSSQLQTKTESHTLDSDHSLPLSADPALLISTHTMPLRSKRPRMAKKTT